MSNSNYLILFVEMPRCCQAIPNEFAPCYASVLVGDVQAKVAALEEGPLRPCITAWCERCGKAYLLTSALHFFKSPSAHHAHMLALADKLAQTGQNPASRQY